MTLVAALRNVSTLRRPLSIALTIDGVARSIQRWAGNPENLHLNPSETVAAIRKGVVRASLADGCEGSSAVRRNDNFLPAQGEVQVVHLEGHMRNMGREDPCCTDVSGHTAASRAPLPTSLP
jgi:hypothetical protein